MSQINLSKEELAEYLKEKGQEAEFTEWLHKKRTSELTLDSLLAPVATGKAQKSSTGSRAELDYESQLYPVVKSAGKGGIKLTELLSKAGLTKDDYGRVTQHFKGAKAGKLGFTLKEGNVSHKKP